MGDVAMTVPVVYSLARQYPDVRITMLSKPFARPFFERMPSNVSFMEADIKDEYDGVKGLNALYRRLTAKNFRYSRLPQRAALRLSAHALQYRPL